MFIAQELKKKNSCEYLLYMWQIEDLLRALDLDMNKIEEHIIKPYNLPADSSKTLYEWYESLIDMMRRENIQQKGHLQLNRNTMSELAELHNDLLRTGKSAEYSAKFYRLLPAIVQLRKQQNDTALSDIEICFNFLYGIMTLKMKKQKISPETEQAQVEISGFMVLLAKNYYLYKSGDLTFDEE